MSKGDSAGENTRRHKVVITNGEVPKEAIELLQQSCDVVVCDELPTPSRADILRRLAGAHGLMWVTKERLDEEVLQAAGPQLRVVSTMSAGYDHVDVAAARRRGLPLGHTPQVLAGAVAEVAVLLALSATRRTVAGRRAIDMGKWEVSRPQWLLGRGLEGATAGVVGFGGVGQETAARLKGFGLARLLYAAPRPRAAEAQRLGAQHVPLQQLLAESDFVFACCPLNADTRHLFGSDAFARMKETAVFVNVSRGEVVDQPALIAALREGQIFAAGLDVTTPEPLSPDHELLTLDNCVVTPHIGSATVQTRREMALLAAQNILAGLRGEKLIAAIP